MVPVPPFTCLLRDLTPATNYSLRVRCANALGPSPYADWVPFRTKGLGKGLTEQSTWAGMRRGGAVSAPVLMELIERGLPNRGDHTSVSQHFTECLLLTCELDKSSPHPAALVLAGGADKQKRLDSTVLKSTVGGSRNTWIEI